MMLFFNVLNLKISLLKFIKLWLFSLCKWTLHKIFPKCTLTNVLDKNDAFYCHNSFKTKLLELKEAYLFGGLELGVFFLSVFQWTILTPLSTVDCLLHPTPRVLPKDSYIKVKGLIWRANLFWVFSVCQHCTKHFMHYPI